MVSAASFGWAGWFDYHDGMNRLAGSSSLYLRQHAHNPVHWQPWDATALEQARSLDRPIFLSIGYSACHWCHVMERESFEDPQVAAILNEQFVPIKVDREERPDLDALYMAAVQALNHGQGGWPMSVWLTPQLEPFYAGTYYPPRDQHGRPAFGRLLLALAEAWRLRREQVVQTAGQIAEFLRQSEQLPPGSGELSANLLLGFARVARHIHEPIHGGFGAAPKFPHALELRLLLRIWRRTGDDEWLAIVRRSLDAMARGGIRDHLGGGFHRYSTDAEWLAPHFEKMLYDNALLSDAYLDAYRATGEPMYREVVESTLDYVLRDMTDPAGPFYSTEDADSEGHEGRFYVWTRAEIEALLGADAELFCSIYDVSTEGNWEGQAILRRTRSDEQDARLHDMPVETLRKRLAAARSQLLAARSRRVRPARDEKIIAAWNGLMIAALARAGLCLDRRDYVAAAERAARFVLERMRRPDGRLLRVAPPNGAAVPEISATLEDYAAMIEALVALYEATYADDWLTQAETLAAVVIDQFEDRDGGAFFTTGRDHAIVIARLKDQHDGSTPSGNGLLATALIRLAEFTGEKRWRSAAERTLMAFRGLLAERPFSCAQTLTALDWWLGPIEQVAIVGPRGSPATARVVRAAAAAFAPLRLTALLDDSSSRRPPWLEGKQAGRDVMTYVCRDGVCSAPIAGPDEAERVLTAIG